jgi:ATP-dependent Clp protease adaptor protein ClpS
MPEPGKNEELSTDSATSDSASSGGVVAAPAKPKTRKATAPTKTPPAILPPWRVMLHNDDKNEMLFVIHTIVELTPLNRESAMHRTLEAHETGVALLLVTHKERAELYQEQFQSKGLTCTIEPEK